MYIADYENNRIVEWKSGALTGQIVAGGKGEGNRVDQLNGPTDVIIDKQSNCLIICDRVNKRVVMWSCQNGTHEKTIISDIDCWGVTMDDNGYLYVSDVTKNEVRRWKTGDTRETIVAGGNGKGNRLDQLSSPTYLFVDHEQSVYVSDRDNHRVVKWMKGAKEGVVVAGGRGQGSSLAQLSNPRGVSVDQLGNVYVVDGDNHRVMRWFQGAKEGTVVVGGNGEGKQANQLNGPAGLTFDRQGNLYVVDWGNNRVQRFNIDSSSKF
jgi:sugar lactone lactonase YvrE